MSTFFVFLTQKLCQTFRERQILPVQRAWQKGFVDLSGQKTFPLGAVVVRWGWTEPFVGWGSFQQPPPWRTMNGNISLSAGRVSFFSTNPGFQLSIIASPALTAANLLELCRWNHGQSAMLTSGLAPLTGRHAKKHHPNGTQNSSSR